MPNPNPTVPLIASVENSKASYIFKYPPSRILRINAKEDDGAALDFVCRAQTKKGESVAFVMRTMLSLSTPWRPSDSGGGGIRECDRARLETKRSCFGELRANFPPAGRHRSTMLQCHTRGMCVSLMPVFHKIHLPRCFCYMGSRADICEEAPVYLAVESLPRAKVFVGSVTSCKSVNLHGEECGSVNLDRSRKGSKRQR